MRLRTLTAPDGTVFRDLNGNGEMEPYENPTLPVARRVDDLLGRLSLPELAGLMFHPVMECGPEGTLLEGVGRYTTTSTTEVLLEKNINHVNVHALGSPREAARWMNRVQAMAEQTPHGIPVTVSTDPRHGFVENSAVSFTAGSFSEWPEPLGLAAIGLDDDVRAFAEIAREEYLAVGIRAALHPSVDLATEPRWSRQLGTLGQDAALTSRLAAVYLDAFQGTGPELDATSVACTTKHFPGGGPQKDGEDPHFPYGREQVYPAGLFEQHLEPFRTAIAHRTSAMMPYYGMPVGLSRDGSPVAEVGFAFNRQVMTGLLREELGFEGVVVTDWQLIHERSVQGRTFVARAWGAEHLTPAERMARLLWAGCDQFGGEQAPALLCSLVEQGMISLSRIRESARRLLAVKFSLGLFDNPFVDEDQAETVLTRPASHAAGRRAQSRSVTVLEAGDLLPLAPGLRLYAEGIPPEVVAEYGEWVDDPALADVAIVRLEAPWELRDDLPLEHLFHSGSLEFSPGLIWRIEQLAAVLPVILDVRLERPAILTPLLAAITARGPSGALVANYGASGGALLDALTGREEPVGRLPFDLPRSMDAVRASAPDAPGDTPDALYRAGHGLTLTKGTAR